MINWKIVVIFPFFAIVISILSGVIGGVSFLDIFVRAILWAILFGGIGIGVSFIVDRFFPELRGALDDESEKVDARAQNEGGFEAFIPEENPHELEEMRTSYFDNEGNENTSDTESVPSQGLGEYEGMDTLTDSDENARSFARGREDEAPRKHDSDVSDFASDEEAGYLSESREETEESLDKPFADSDNEEPDESPFVFDDDSIDKLPDSSSIEDAASLSSTDSSLDSGGSFSKPYKNASVSEFQQDPHKTARAIHTMIQRDKEG